MKRNLCPRTPLFLNFPSLRETGCRHWSLCGKPPSYASTFVAHRVGRQLHPNLTQMFRRCHLHHEKSNGCSHAARREAEWQEANQSFWNEKPRQVSNSKSSRLLQQWFKKLQSFSAFLFTYPPFPMKIDMSPKKGTIALKENWIFQPSIFTGYSWVFRVFAPSSLPHSMSFPTPFDPPTATRSSSGSTPTARHCESSSLELPPATQQQQQLCEKPSIRHKKKNPFPCEMQNKKNGPKRC